MANEEQLSILKQGVDVWNQWRGKNIQGEIDLSGADLRTANLPRAMFLGVNLSGANLRNSNLEESYSAMADFTDADLREVDFSEANLRDAFLINANLTKADLLGAKLMQAEFGGANLSKAQLHEVNFTSAFLAGCNFSRSVMRDTIFGSVDLSGAIGLDDVVHEGPSTIGADTIAKSKGKIPEIFLRGCGLSDTDIEYSKLSNPDLNNEEISKILYRIYDLRASQALQISPLFISYSHDDNEFVEKIEIYLTEKGIRYWRDIHDMKAGRMEKQIDRAIRQNPTVLLILSENSLSSDWVEHEVRTARELEKNMGRDIFCPVALDDSWKSSPWPKRIMEQIMEYNILDFSAWKDDSKFDGMFRKLIDGLELFYKG